MDRLFIRKSLIVFAVVFFSVAVLALGPLILLRLQNEQKRKTLRTFSVCALIDEQSPTEIRESDVRGLIDDASANYVHNIGIVFHVVEVHKIKFESLASNVPSRQFRSRCSGGDIVAIFSNRRNWISIWGRPVEELGHADSVYGVIVIFNFESRLRDHSCYDAALVTVEHELAHLFGAQHCPDPHSFMSVSYDCSADWPSGLMDTVLKHKYRNFNPPN